MKRIAILTPTRERAERLDFFIGSVYTHSSKSNRITFYNYIDNDDSQLEGYEKVSKKYNHVINTIGEPISVSMSWNIIAKQAVDLGDDILIMGNDDVYYKTVDWDNILLKHLESYKDDIYCAWFNDLINGPNHCAFPIVSKKWYETLGYFTPGCFEFGYNDTWVYDIAKRIGRTHYIPEVIGEHMHFTTGKYPIDNTTKRNRTAEKGNMFARDKIKFENTISDRIIDSDKLKKVMHPYLEV